MLATVQMYNGRFEVIGLRKPSVPRVSPVPDKPMFEMVCLHSFCGKSYKTKENAIKALIKKGLEYIADEEITTYIGWD